MLTRALPGRGSAEGSAVWCEVSGGALSALEDGISRRCLSVFRLSICSSSSYPPARRQSTSACHAHHDGLIGLDLNLGYNLLE